MKQTTVKFLFKSLLFLILSLLQYASFAQSSADSIIIEVPNIFTPNNDGTNDVFIVKTKGVIQLKCFFYDRYGVLVNDFQFDIEDTLMNNYVWDGTTTAGLYVPSGTYFYTIKATGIDEALYERKGFL